MRVRALYPHIDCAGAEHAVGDEYELADDSNELKLRLKDGIVCPATTIQLPAAATPVAPAGPSETKEAPAAASAATPTA